MVRFVNYTTIKNSKLKKWKGKKLHKKIVGHSIIIVTFGLFQLYLIYFKF